jgi:putative ABC transport system permease protein
MPIGQIPLSQLALIFIPVAVVVAIQWRWSLPYRDTLYGLSRMVVQLLAVGYILVFLFESESPLTVSAVLFVMITISSWIALRPLGESRPRLYWIALLSIIAGCVPVLILATQLVIDVEPWYAPHYLIPLAGMIFANSMNPVSIAGERYQAELDHGHNPEKARYIAMQTAMIPLVNSLMAVGLVSLPGMMTGQVLSGVSPLIAARYQILVMCMLFSASGISVACFLHLWGRRSAH